MRLFKWTNVLILSTGLAVLGIWGWTQVTAESGRASSRVSAKSAVPQPARKSGDLHLEGSRVYIHVGKTGLGHEHAVMGKLSSGSIKLGANVNAGTLVFDMPTFDADSDRARQYIGLSGSTDVGTRNKVNANMQGADVLDVQQFPAATFQITAARPVADKSGRGLPQYQLDGQFTLHGQTQNISILADVEEKKAWLHLRGSFAILQTDYGIQPFSKAFGAIGVANQLTIWGDFWIAK